MENRHMKINRTMRMAMLGLLGVLGQTAASAMWVATAPRRDEAK
jgi:hypothetical protein